MMNYIQKRDILNAVEKLIEYSNHAPYKIVFSIQFEGGEYTPNKEVKL